jgi:hypothetical protein
VWPSRMEGFQLAFVFFVRNLRRHVSLSAQLGLQHSRAVLAPQQAGETEVCNLEDKEMGE